MFTRVEIQNFRSLRDVSVNLSNFHVLVGANGSGKTTFLDVFAFVGDMLREGIAETIQNRRVQWEELLFSGSQFQDVFFAFEALLPEGILEASPLNIYDSVRYEVRIYKSGRGFEINREDCHLFRSDDPPSQWRTKGHLGEMRDIISDAQSRGLLQEHYLEKGVKAYSIVNRGNEAILTSTNNLEINWLLIGKDSFAINNVADDENKYPVTTWFKNQFKKFIQTIEIESDAINKAGREGRPGIVSRDGSNLPWLIDSLKKTYPDRYKLWLRNVQFEFPEIKAIKTVPREDQNDMFFKIKYKEGHEFKQWMLSDGTLRYLLLTIIPYDLNLKGLFLIEEPEIGINPRAIQAIMDSLRGVYDQQVFVTTHSPELVNCCTKKEVLVFSKNAAGETEIVLGTEHTRLKDWKGDIGSGVFYSLGIMN